MYNQAITYIIVVLMYSIFIYFGGPRSISIALCIRGNLNVGQRILILFYAAKLSDDARLSMYE